MLRLQQWNLHCHTSQHWTEHHHSSCCAWHVVHVLPLQFVALAIPLSVTAASGTIHTLVPSLSSKHDVITPARLAQKARCRLTEGAAAAAPVQAELRPVAVAAFVAAVPALVAPAADAAPVAYAQMHLLPPLGPAGAPGCAAYVL